MDSFDTLMGFLNHFSVFISIGTFCFVILNFFLNLKKQDQITISIKRGEAITPLPITILRQQVTRSEIMGILGAFDKDSRFNIAYTKQKAFFDAIAELGRNRRKKELIIYIQENDDFDLALSDS